MGITETIVIYGLVGITVSAAIWLSAAESSSPLEALVHAALWPLFAPTLLEPRTERTRQAAPERHRRSESRIEEVESNILTALDALDGAPEDVLRPETNRIRSLLDALDAMAARRDDMCEMLSEAQFDRARATERLEELERSPDADESRLESLRNRIRHIDQLEDMHEALSDDIDRTLLKLEEMTSQIRLLRFAGSPAEEVSDLVRDITATVEGLSEGLMTGTRTA
jgi:DNA repair ATPase RecN